MSLRITQLSVRDFRCYEEFTLELAPDLTVLCGPNAVGKTNLVEAIQLLTAGESFRRPQWKEIVRWGAERAYASLNLTGGGRNLSVEMSIDRGRREYRVNDKPKRKMSDVVGILPSVVFVPDDLRLTKESAEKRRLALDSLGIQMSPAYLTLKNEYERILKQRNRLLKEGASGESLATWTERLMDTGAAFTDARQRLFDRLEPKLLKAHDDVAGERPALSARYVTAAERDGGPGAPSVVEGMRWHLSAREREEGVRGTSLIGPHRDEVSFRLDGRDARAFASQGQHRSVALAWKLAEVAVIEEVTGQTPVLLLDDVMSELDQRRRRALATKAGLSAQTVITTTNTGYFDEELMNRARVVELG